MKTITTRHNSFGVDITGPAACVDGAVAALNCHDKLVRACQHFLKAIASRKTGAIRPAKDFSDWATVEFMVNEALADEVTG